MIFSDRADAGSRLAAACRDRAAGWPRAVVLGIPRGGVPVAAPVARALNAPLDVIIVRKLGLPLNEEVAMGAIGEGVRVLDDGLIRAMGVTDEQLAKVEERESAELERRVRRYRDARHPVELAGATAI
ncbi:MAG TPA: phosphoribosyltransferase family protein, partial [Humibacter sp.]|nr:phosphoribosyltransferase family protein [Humibacter sp.]